MARFRVDVDEDAQDIIDTKTNQIVTLDELNRIASPEERVDFEASLQ